MFFINFLMKAFVKKSTKSGRILFENLTFLLIYDENLSTGAYQNLSCSHCKLRTKLIRFSFFNPSLWWGVKFTPCWFFLNNSETVTL